MPDVAISEPSSTEPAVAGSARSGGRTLERLVLDRGRYVIANALEGDAVFRPTSFEALEIPLAKLWKILAEEVR